MNNPYRVLGVSENADMDEIKKAYRTLSRKYHPDTNINNPNKAEAEEKFKEVQAAYEQIVDEREHGKSRSYGYGESDFGGFGRGSGSSGNSGSNYEQAVINYINYGRYKEALNALSYTPAEERTARWYYLSAVANHKLGYTVVALEHAETAARMEPSNYDYQNLVRVLQGGGTWYNDVGSGYSRMDNSGCLSNCLYCLACNLCLRGFFCC
ncbi:MAG: J domain-containing protein [Lachnospiraceae bacterium]|nr:J domain-containing protein [Lachnospiraceae bacterium]